MGDVLLFFIPRWLDYAPSNIRSFQTQNCLISLVISKKYMPEKKKKTTTITTKKHWGSWFQSDSNRAFYYKGSFQLECWKSDNVLRCKVTEAGKLGLPMAWFNSAPWRNPGCSSYQLLAFSLLFWLWVSLYIVIPSSLPWSSY